LKRERKTSKTAGATADERLERLGRELRKRREVAGLTQGQLAKRVGKSTATISKIEAAKQPLDMPTFLAIADELRVAPEQLMLRIELTRQSETPLQQRILDVFKRTLESIDTR